MIEPGRGGNFLAEIAGQRQNRDTWIVLTQTLDNRAGVIGAAVIDVNRLPTAERVHDRAQAGVEGGEAYGLIERRNHHRTDWGRVRRKKSVCNVQHRAIR